MKKCLFILILEVVLTGQFGLSQATTTPVFLDNSNTDGSDASKWSPVIDSGCPLEVSSGALHTYFDARDAHAKSANIQLLPNWNSVTVTGQWAFPVHITGKIVPNIWDADTSQNWCGVAYSTYGGSTFNIQVQDSTPGFFVIHLLPFRNR
jgi:hypothetical protein